MQKMIIAALVLLCVQIGLMLAFNMGNKGIDASSPDTLFLSFSPDSVQSVEITDGEGKKIELQKDKDGWVEPANFSAPVDESKVNELLRKLAEMKLGFVVATSKDAAKRFKVDADSFERHVVLKGGEETLALADFYIGTSPAFRQVHARRGDSDGIVNISLAGFELETAPDKWLNTSFVMIRDEDLQELTFADFTLKKGDKNWQLEGLQDGETIDREEVNNVVNKARGLIIQDVLDPAQMADLFRQPAFRFTAVKQDGKKVEYVFAKGQGDFYVLKLSDRDFYFKVHTLAAEALQKETRGKLVKVAAAQKVENIPAERGPAESDDAVKEE